jgi:predicted MPP superfamily phosphohydrolase
MFITFILLLVYELINLAYPLSKIISGIIILVLVLIICLYAVINASIIKVNSYDIPINNLQKDINIVQISDVHLGPIRSESYLKELVEKINILNPELVFITGDLTDGSIDLSKENLLPLKDLKAKTFFVTGNHETFGDVNLFLNNLKENNVFVLQNELTNYNGLQIIGVNNYETTDDFNNVFSKINYDVNKLSILLFHQPLKLDLIKDKVNLHLAGHTHNGQIFPFRYFVYLRYDFISGLRYVNNTYQYVSQGTGTWGPYMRLFTNNEITFITLKKSK